MNDTLPLESEASAPWDVVAVLVEQGDGEKLVAFLDAVGPEGVARAVSRLSPDDREALLHLLPSDEAADLLEDLPEAEAASLVGILAAGEAAEILVEMEDEDQADLLQEIGPRETEAILEEMDAGEAAEARELADYDRESAGGLMSRRCLAFVEDQKVADVLEQLAEHAEEYSDFDVQYAYVTSADGRLIGVLRLRDLVLTKRLRPIREIMIPEPISVKADLPLQETAALFDQFAFLGVPVIDEKERLLGVVQREAVNEALERRARKTFLKISGIIGGEELRSLPLRSRCIRRLAFLCPNIILNLVAASVIAMYQDTLEAVIALAVFLPIVSDMSGCSGNQAVAVSIRELTLGVIRPREFFRVISKEGALGLINGLVVGALLGTIAFLWKDNIYLGLVIGGALAVNTLLSVLLGGLVPLLLRAFRVDPALASAPILTTVTDMCGFFLVLNFASLMLSRLT